MSFADWLKKEVEEVKAQAIGPSTCTAAMQRLKEKHAETQVKAMVAEEIDKISEYAIANTPPQGAGGDLYMGHPIQDLLANVQPALRVSVRSEITRRFGPSNVGSMRSPPRVYTYKEKMEMRMGWQPNEHKPFAFVEYRSVQDTAFMWILTNDAQSVVLEDEAALFPSDALITKVRLLGGTNG